MKAVLLSFLTLATGAFSQELPKPMPGFSWKYFPNECIEIQVPDGWYSKELDHHPAKTLFVGPTTNTQGMETGFTLNTVVCHNPQEWRDAYFSALKVWSESLKAIKALGKPIIEKAIQQEGMQVFISEGDQYIPSAALPGVKYHVQFVVRAFPKLGIVYAYSYGAPSTQWVAAWRFGQTIFNPFVFRLPNNNG